MANYLVWTRVLYQKCKFYFAVTLYFFTIKNISDTVGLKGKKCGLNL